MPSWPYLHAAVRYFLPHCRMARIELAVALAIVATHSRRGARSTACPRQCCHFYFPLQGGTFASSTELCNCWRWITILYRTMDGTICLLQIKGVHQTHSIRVILLLANCQFWHLHFLTHRTSVTNIGTYGNQWTPMWTEEHKQNKDNTA